MRRSLIPLFALILVVVFVLPSCNRPQATIVPKLQINKKSAEMGTPVEVTYTFSTKKDYIALNKDLWVFCHFLDPKKVIRFQDDHQPVIQWAKGWYDPETVPNDINTQWKWTKKEAVLKVRNPNSNALLYFKADGNIDRFGKDPQVVTLKIGDTVIDSFPITSNQPFLKKYPIEKSKLGNGKMLEVKVEVDKTFKPAEDKVSADTRELGIRVYELYLGKAAD